MLSLTGRLAKNESNIQDYNPPEKKVALAKLMHIMLNLCQGKGCTICKAIEELRHESKTA